MSLLNYIDNEVPVLGEWSGRTQASPSSIAQSSAASFPERGNVGLRVATSVGNAAYVYKTGVKTLGAGEVLYMGYWLNVQAGPDTLYTRINCLQRSGNDLVWLYLYPDGHCTLGYRTDGGPSATGSYTSSGWTYIVVALRRATTNVASDGYVRFYANGALIAEATGKDNYDIANGSIDAWCGNYSQVRDDTVFYLDEIKIADAYPEPFVPTPTTDYVDASRTVVLYRQGSTDSKTFADYCVSELGVPRCNLCPLPNATADETLADYATFQSEVETDLAAWLALNPTVADNCMCFMLGYGVPGYFTHGGARHSAVSRLMHYGTAFSSATVNPLHLGDTGLPTARLTVTDLRTAGAYLAVRIDADTLAHAEAIVDRSLVVSALSAIPATDKLYSDNTPHKASLACQKLRIITDAIDEFAADAFVWGDAGILAFGDAGSRVIFCDDSLGSASTMRATSATCGEAILTALYAAAIGNSNSFDLLGISPTPFFEMLRIGGTLVEAFAVAVNYVDYTAVALGDPLMRVGFQLGGYNVYRGIGGVEDIDWDSPIAYLRAGENAITFSQDMAVGQKYVYGVRAVSSAGVEERGTRVITYAEVDEQGNLLSAPLVAPVDLTVDVQQSSLLFGFSYRATSGFSEADGFDIFSDNGSGELDTDTPIATVERSRKGQSDFEISIVRPGVPVLLAVRARTAQRIGPVSGTIFVPVLAVPSSVSTL